MPDVQDDTIFERVAVAIKSKLETIQSIRGVKPAGVVRPTKMGGYTPKHLLMLVEQDDMTINEDLCLVGNPPATAWDVPYKISLLSRPTDKTSEAIDIWNNAFLATIAPLIMEDVQWTDGDQPLALNTQWGNTTKIVTQDSSHEGIEIVAIVTIRCPDDDLTAVR